MKLRSRIFRRPYYDKWPVRSIQVGDIKVAYKMFGSGAPLVMITGYMATMDMWAEPFIEALARDFQVVVFDNRGMGKTSDGTAEWSIDRFADDTAAFINKIGFMSADVLGWSLGGDVSLDLALRHPEKVSRLVVYAGDCGGPRKVDPPRLRDVLKEYRDVEAHFRTFFAELFPPEWMEEHPDYWKSFSFPRGIDSPDSIIRQNRAYNEWAGCYEELPDIHVPTLLVTGTEDVSTPPENSAMLAEHIPGSWLIRFRGAGHGLQYQYPDKLAQVVTDFINLTG